MVTSKEIKLKDYYVHFIPIENYKHKRLLTRIGAK